MHTPAITLLGFLAILAANCGGDPAVAIPANQCECVQTTPGAIGAPDATDQWAGEVCALDPVAEAVADCEASPAGATCSACTCTETGAVCGVVGSP